MPVDFLKKYNYLFLVLLLFSVVAFVYLFSGKTIRNDPLANIKCPEDYENSDEKMAALKKFTDYFYDNHPNASLSDFLDARYNFWVEHNCTAAIKGYNDYINNNLDAEGKIKAEIIDKAIDEYDNK